MGRHRPCDHELPHGACPGCAHRLRADVLRRNCVLNTTGDIDEFTFKAAAGDTWQVILGLGASPATNINLVIYAPGIPLTAIYNASTNIYACCGGAYYAVSTNQPLAVAGNYIIQVTETSDAVQTYALSLERLSPTPPDATPLVLSQGVTGAVNAPTEQITYSFNGGTTGEYGIVASLPPSPTSNVCMSVYQPNGTSVLPGGQYSCTNIFACCGGATYSVQNDLVPTVDGEYVVEITAGGDDTTVAFNLEVSCLSGPGTCPPVKQRCVLTDSPTYNATSGTLTMNFTVGTPVAATWNGWLTQNNKIQSIFSQSQAVTEPPIDVTQTKADVAVSGTVGILSTLTTKAQGITCSSFVTVNTGTP